MNGYCCSAITSPRNGDCPLDALIPLLQYQQVTNATYHMCSGPIKARNNRGRSDHSFAAKGNFLLEPFGGIVSPHPKFYRSTGNYW